MESLGFKLNARSTINCYEGDMESLAVDTDDKQSHAFIASRGCQALAFSKSRKGN